jgi:hypothetical protein
MSAATCFVVAQPTYEDDGLDSIWLDERDAKKRAAELGTAFITEYRFGSAGGFVRNGWYTKGQRRRLCWSDWK